MSKRRKKNKDHKPYNNKDEQNNEENKLINEIIMLEELEYYKKEIALISKMVEAQIPLEKITDAIKEKHTIDSLAKMMVNSAMMEVARRDQDSNSLKEEEISEYEDKIRAKKAEAIDSIKNPEKKKKAIDKWNEEDMKKILGQIRHSIHPIKGKPTLITVSFIDEVFASEEIGVPMMHGHVSDIGPEDDGWKVVRYEAGFLIDYINETFHPTEFNSDSIAAYIR